MSTLSSQKQCGPALDALPTEIQLLILKALVKDGYTLSHLAAVSRDWQAEIERYNFARIKLTPSRLAGFGPMVHRNRALVQYIWLCLELEEYDCTKCAPTGRLSEDEMVEMYAINDTTHGPITTAFENLFAVLSTWDPNGNLTLDISVYSHSDSKHWFKYLTFMPDISSDELGDDVIEQTTLDQVHNDPQHGWGGVSGYSAPHERALHRIFHAIMDEGPFESEKLELKWWDQLPSVRVVTKLLLRQQNRRRWRPDALAHMFARFPRLEEVHYEPWREWSFIKRDTDARYKYLFKSIQRSNFHLKRLVIFENFNQHYPAFEQRFLDGVDLTGCESIRIPDPDVSRIIAATSLRLEHLAASFIVDAIHFFEIEPLPVWSNLTSLVLTSKILAPNENPIEIESLLQTAVHATLTWRATWSFAMKSTIKAWKAVMHHHYSGWTLDVIHERLSGADINSHGDAIHHLNLSSQVVRPISLQQIQREQKALEGIQSVYTK
ncbi:hypothetical protein TGAM01_v208064 [Trichoderma gamsii]|uniref:DUF6546 domain-containing protein n=1 Tax=Trichoderma gamsii TaxID=398673 RepID=A0A2P4ZFK2_9HYPO|nr:hypothetical protein TGAM01_v208064 [Trichoderma gamsii]PON23059.1 hypothetical protein TGAM01_v208064 [Trichoderma gamsii]